MSVQTHWRRFTREEIERHPLGLRGLVRQNLPRSAFDMHANSDRDGVTVHYSAEVNPPTIFTHRASRVANMKPRWQRPTKEKS